MRRLIAAATLLLAPSLFAHDHGQNISITTDDYEDVTSCSQIRVTFDHEAALRAEEELPVGSLGSLKNSSGTIDAATVNGPIALAGGSGNVKISATNGPLSVKLTGTRWDGTLDATTQNGPVSLKLPRNFGSGVDVTVNGHGPISCKAEACRDMKRSWHDDDNDTPRRLSFGSGTRNVTLSTNNGPVGVKEAE